MKIGFGTGLTTRRGLALVPNMITGPEDFTNGAWLTGGLGSAVNANAATAPDGAVTADRLIDNAATGTGLVGIAQVASLSPSTTYTLSVHGEPDQLLWLAIHCVALTSPADGGVWFNLSTGAIGTQNAGYTGSVKSAAEGFYRCGVTFTTASDTAGQIRFYVCEADGSLSATRDGTSSLFLWGAMLHPGSGMATYNPNS